MVNEQLVLLTLDLTISGLWENEVVKKFPETSFVIREGHPSGSGAFSGLLKIENGNFDDIQRFVQQKYPNVSLDNFHNDSNLFFYLDSNFPLADIFGKVNCVLNWPVSLNEDFKRMKLVLKEEDVDKVVGEVEDAGVSVLNLSKIRIDFGFEEILTPKQKEILTPSLKLGYYEFPKRINLNSLAARLNISPSTLCVHLQKIEHKILNLNYSELLFGRLS